ncbi:MAG: hypothetical protein NTU76_01370 [Candidatus Taylorbacteria bacterium]|nr:hypothetical protein [Candidatus Taylorbacteria bacterium]
MQKFPKQNWLKLGVMVLIVIIIFSFAHYLGQKNKVVLKEEVKKTEIVEQKKVEEQKQNPFSYLEDVQRINENRPARFQTEEAKAIESALPEKAFLRDFVELPNNKGTLVLYVEPPYTLGRFPGMDTDEDGIIDEPVITCSDIDYGQQLEGIYRLGLVRDGEFLGTTYISKGDYSPNYPMFRNFKGNLDGTWSNDGVSEDSKMEIVEPPLLKLQDLNGDGLAYEISFKVGYDSCGNNDYTIGAYDPTIDHPNVYSIESGDTYTDTHMNFFPNPDGSVDFSSGCDHGKSNQTKSRYVFDEKLRTYELKKVTKRIPCG